ncbi:hypothetical protein F4820DRAFT_261792 [Hypoxylon rubiginosum]|uniref:Uncharacterized protein n=1 Tax=Hypoxylon rubiginosum TaxID=110542 RepID=A0ACB9Z4R4_9PEZI|nr:hypothetical protein F4820DRAFT_261792 [Hypoxylon rubiginosum]
MSSSLADADPPPTQHDFVAFSTPMLAAIGQKNVKVIEVLLKQKGFNPTRQFRGMTYYEIAEKRRGPAWKDEVRILQQAYDDYDDYVARYWNYTSGQNDRSGVIPPANGADTTANVSVLQEPVHRNRAVERLYICEPCKTSFTRNVDLERHQKLCGASQLLLDFTAKFPRLKQEHTQLPIRTWLKTKPADPHMPTDSKRVSTSDMNVTSELQAPTGSQGHENPRTTCIHCSTQITSLWRRSPEGQPLCNICWVFLSVHKVPRPLNQNGNVTKKHRYADSLPGGSRKTAMLTDDNRHESLLQHNNKQPMPEPTECEQSDPSGTDFTSVPGSPSESSLSSPRRTSEIASPCTTPSQGESEASSNSMNEGSEDGLDEEENVYIRRAEKKHALLRDLMDIVYSSYSRLAASGTTEEGESGTSGATRESPTAGQSSGNQRNKSRDPKGKRRLSRGDEDNDNEEGDEGQQPKRAKSGVDGDGLDRARKFACPYYQRSHHRRHANTNLPRRACYGPGFLTVHRLKEHLYRAHRLPLVCPRCDTQIDSELSLENHMRQDPPCVTRPKQLREGINSTTEKLLRSRNKDFNKKTEADKWRYVYTMIFPADNPRDLPSPYHENHIEANFADSPHLNTTAKRYEEFLQRELCPRIYRVLESRIDEALESAERDATDTLKSQLQGIFRDVQAELHDEFHAAIPVENEANPVIPVETTAGMPIPDLNPILPDSWSLHEPWSSLVMDDRPAALDSSIPLFGNELEGISNVDFDFDLLTGLAGADNHHNLEVAATTVPFKVKAIYDYTSDHAEDLSFGIGQIVTVTDEEDSNWYGGGYVDDCGAKKEGIFPQNLVERYKPPTPPRPRRSREGDANIVHLPPPNNVPFPRP